MAYPMSDINRLHCHCGADWSKLEGPKCKLTAETVGSPLNDSITTTAATCSRLTSQPDIDDLT